MQALGSFHPQLVHAPIALLIVSALFMLVGRFTDGGWWRRAGVALLVIGFLGGVAALKSGEVAGDRAEDQGVPEHAVDAHEDAARLTLWLAGGALVLLGLAPRIKRASGALEALALALQLGAAVAVGVTGHRGGKLVYEHGAAVKVDGIPVLRGHVTPAPGGAAAESSGAASPEPRDTDRDARAPGGTERR